MTTMRGPTARGRVLDPGDRIAEMLFGLIMALTFTGSLSIADAGRDDVRAMLVGALGCNLAWGLIDGVFYLFFRMADRGEDRETLQAVHRAKDPAHARRRIAEVLPPSVAAIVGPGELESLRRRMLALPAPAGAARLDGRDWLGALAVFLLVFLSTFPLAVPFFFMQRVGPAMRVSNAIAIGMLFVAGLAYARHLGTSRWLTGMTMVMLGCILVAITIALGG